MIGLQLPTNENFRFLAGQYVDILLKDGKRRSYSHRQRADPSGVTALELHIRHMPGGLFTDHVFGTLKERDILRFEGPLGSFFLREESDKPIVLLASGTGFAPIKAIIETRARDEARAEPAVTLYWGCRVQQDLYMNELAQSWARPRLQVRAGALGEPRTVERPHGLRAPGGDGGFARPVAATRSMPAARRSGRVGPARFHRAVRPAGRRVLRRLVHYRGRQGRRLVMANSVLSTKYSMPVHSRRQLLLATLAALISARVWGTDTTTTKPVRIIVPFPAGGGTDVLARIIGEKLRGNYART